MTQKWFGISRYWGWYPIKWEGWLILTGMMLSIAATFFAAATKSTSLSNSLVQAFPFIALIVSLTIFIASITGIKPAFGIKSSKNYSRDKPKAYLFLSLLTLPIALYYIFLGELFDSSILIIVFCLLYLTYTNLLTRKS